MKKTLDDLLIEEMAEQGARLVGQERSRKTMEATRRDFQSLYAGKEIIVQYSREFATIRYVFVK